MRLLQALLVVAVWLLVLSSADPLDVALGAVLAVAVLAVPRPGPRWSSGDARPLRRALAFPRLATAIAWDVLSGTWDVALRVVGLRALERPGLVEVPLEERTDVGVAVSALATTLSPGSVLVEVDEERRVMVLHVIDASDPEAVRRSHRRFYEAAQRGVFP